MTLGPEKLDVYRLSIGYVAWVYEKAAGLNGVQRPARDQWLNADVTKRKRYRREHRTVTPPGEALEALEKAFWHGGRLRDEG